MNDCQSSIVKHHSICQRIWIIFCLSRSFGKLYLFIFSGTSIVSAQVKGFEIQIVLQQMFYEFFIILSICSIHTFLRACRNPEINEIMKNYLFTNLI